MQWIQDKLTEYEVYRKDTPAFGNSEECNAYHKALSEKLIEAIRDNDLKAYLDDGIGSVRSTVSAVKSGA